MRIADVKVGTKLISGFMLVALIVLIVGGVGIYNLKKVGDSANIIALDKAPIVDATMELTIALTEQQSALHAYMIGEFEAKEEFEAAGMEFDNWLADIKGQNLSDHEKDMVKKLEGEYPLFVKNSGKL